MPAENPRRFWTTILSAGSTTWIPGWAVLTPKPAAWNCFLRKKPLRQIRTLIWKKLLQLIRILIWKKLLWQTRMLLRKKNQERTITLLQKKPLWLTGYSPFPA